MWILLSLLASILWGLTYVLSQHLYYRISVYSFISLTSFFVFVATLLAAYFSSTLGADLAALASSRRLVFLLAAAGLTSVFAEILIGLSIKNKNATLASLIEVSYPFFIALFAGLLFKEPSPRATTMVGGLLILAGVFVISYFNR
jgi:drug/metabolite transporter (DMT)-like permease